MYEVIAHLHDVDVDTARFIARRLMEVWNACLPCMGIGAGDYDITTTVQGLDLVDDHNDSFLLPLLGGATALDACPTVEPGWRSQREVLHPDRLVEHHNP